MIAGLLSKLFSGAGIEVKRRSGSLEIISIK
jgi:hypothetical protein